MFQDKVAKAAATKAHDKFDKIEQNIEHKMEGMQRKGYIQGAIILL
jgi:hypothetical protein